MRRTPFGGPALAAGLLILVLTLATAPAAANLAPTASFTFTPQDPRPGQEVLFESTSTDPDGTITQWFWELPGGVTADTETVRHTFVDEGIYTVTLTVFDDVGAGHQVGLPVPVQKAPDATSFLPNWLFWLMPLVLGLLLLMISYMVVSKGQPAIYNLVFFLLFATSAVKSLTEAVAVLTAGTSSAVNAAAIVLNAAMGYLLVPMFLWFVLVFPRPVRPWLKHGKRGAVTLLLAVPFLVNLQFGFLDVSARDTAFNILASVCALAGLGLLVYHAWETDSDEERRRIRLLAWAFAILVLSTLVVSALQVAHTVYEHVGMADQAARVLRLIQVFLLVVSPLLELVAATLLMYAILRYQLLGIERLVVKMTRNGVIAILMPSIFVVVSNVIEEVFQRTVLADFEYDFIVAGFVSALCLIPLQKWTEFLVNRLFPGVAAGAEEEKARRRVEIFEAQLRYSLLDGRLNEKEIGVLDRLHRSLGLSDPELASVVSGFEGAEFSMFPPLTRAADAPA